MLTGDAVNTDTSKVDGSNICHRCWTSPNEDVFIGGAPCTGSDTVEIPSDPSCKMIRQTLIFPALVYPPYSPLHPRLCFLTVLTLQSIVWRS